MYVPPDPHGVKKWGLWPPAPKCDAHAVGPNPTTLWNDSGSACGPDPRPHQQNGGSLAAGRDQRDCPRYRGLSWMHGLVDAGVEPIRWSGTEMQFHRSDICSGRGSLPGESMRATATSMTNLYLNVWSLRCGHRGIPAPVRTHWIVFDYIGLPSFSFTLCLRHRGSVAE